MDEDPPHSHLPVPRQTTTTSAAPTALTTSACEYQWHCGSRQPAATLTLAASVSSPLLQQGRAESTGAAEPQGTGTLGTPQVAPVPSEGSSGSSSSPGQCPGLGDGRKHRAVSPGSVDVPRLWHWRIVPKQHSGVVSEGTHYLRRAEG